MKWFAFSVLILAVSWAVWEQTQPDAVEAYEIVEVERHGIKVKLAKNGEYCSGIWDGYTQIPTSAEHLGPHIYASPMPDDSGVYLEMYITDGVTGARAAGTESCWTH